MRVKRAKSYRRAMSFYHTGFGFREPYQVLLAPDFIVEAVASKISLKNDISEVTQGPVKQLVSFCTVGEIRNKGDEAVEASVAIKSFERRRCKHKVAIPGVECIKEIIGEKNEHNYCVAVQDDKIRAELRKIPGVPIIHVKKKLLVLEPITQLSKDEIKSREKERLSATSIERKLAKQIKYGDKPTRQISKKKALKVKGPNPLSMMKSKKQKNAHTTTKPNSEIKQKDPLPNGSNKGDKTESAPAKESIGKAKSEPAVSGSNVSGIKRSASDQASSVIENAPGVVPQGQKKRRKRIRTHKKKGNKQESTEKST